MVVVCLTASEIGDLDVVEELGALSSLGVRGARRLAVVAERVSTEAVVSRDFESICAYVELAPVAVMERSEGVEP